MKFPSKQDISIQENAVENDVCKMATILTRPQCIIRWNSLFCISTCYLDIEQLSSTFIEYLLLEYVDQKAWYRFNHTVVYE